MGLFNEDCYQRLLERQKKGPRRVGGKREEDALKKRAYRVVHGKPKKKIKRGLKPGRKLHGSKDAQLLIMACENATAIPNALLRMDIERNYDVWRARVVLFYCLKRWAHVTTKELCEVYNLPKYKVSKNISTGKKSMTNPKIHFQYTIAAMIRETYEPFRIKYLARFGKMT